MNKVDRPDARIEEVVEETLRLFMGPHRRHRGQRRPADVRAEVEKFQQVTGYSGHIHRTHYLKIAWGHSKDNTQTVDQLRKAKQPVPPKMEALATVHGAVAGKLDAFITGLVVDGFIGDELVKKAN
ncbi:MAG: hypothetical protein HC868_11170, partial [Sphingomonadales bacterium]|nr:hypothetical protein [Sphingomonadales bacterium]